MRRLGLLLLPALLAQEPPAIRVNVNLIQIDATVTDKKGRHLPGLTAADFEVFQNGKRQKISSALWVAGRPPARQRSSAPPPAGRPPRHRRPHRRSQPFPVQPLLHPPSPPRFRRLQP